MAFTRYVLRLAEGKFYVGFTSRAVDRRVSEHRDSPSNRFVSENGVVGILSTHAFETEDEARLDERNETLRLMADVGIENVRGAAWTTFVLSASTRTELERIITEQTGVCYLCKETGHYASECSLQKAKPGGRDRAPKRSRVGARSCESCGTDLVRAPQHHRQCRKCYSSSSVKSPEPRKKTISRRRSVASNRRCSSCRDDISSRPPAHKLCLRCWRAQSDSESESDSESDSQSDSESDSVFDRLGMCSSGGGRWRNLGRGVRAYESTESESDY